MNVKTTAINHKNLIGKQVTITFVTTEPDLTYKLVEKTYRVQATIFDTTQTSDGQIYVAGRPKFMNSPYRFQDKWHRIENVEFK